jgi:hypothetical protein
LILNRVVACLLFTGALLGAQQNSRAHVKFRIPSQPVFVASTEQNPPGAGSDKSSRGDLLLIGILDRNEPSENAPSHADENPESYFYATRYFHPGARLNLYSGGAAMGEIAIVGTENYQCDSRVGKASFSRGSQLKGISYALATNASEIKTHPDHQRPPTEDEKAEALAVVRNIYLGQGVAEAALSHMEIHSLVETQVDHSGERVLIGSFFVGSKEADYQLFVILAGPTTQLHTQFIRYNKISDVEDQKDSEEETFVDQLDLDGDGIDELATVVTYYEAEDFRILKRFGNQWREVHKGGSGGC